MKSLEVSEQEVFLQDQLELKFEFDFFLLLLQLLDKFVWMSEFLKPLLFVVFVGIVAGVSPENRHEWVWNKFEWMKTDNNSIKSLNTQIKVNKLRGFFFSHESILLMLLF